jgi:hypothetical protein
MQIQLDDIDSGERLLRQASEEEFVDAALPGEADPALLFACRMGRHHHPAGLPLRVDGHRRAVVEGTHKLASRTALVPIGRQVQAGLDLGLIQHSVLFAAHHKREASQVGEHRPGAILPIQSQQGALLGKLVRSEVASDGGESPTQFLAIEPVASIAETAEPTFSYGPD